MAPVIHTIQLTRHFGARVAVENLDLEVQPGEVFGFLGPNGAGKTTTIGMLLGLIRPTSGQAFVCGYDIQRAPEAALRSVGAMIEAPAFYPYLSGRENLRVLALASGIALQRVDAVLELVELTKRASDRFQTYSMGMKQRLGIAAALLNDPQLIMLDEPTSGLDPGGQNEIRTLIAALAQAGRTIFLSSHMLPEVEQLCKRVAILKDGRIVAQGAIRELLGRGRGILVRTAGDAGPAQELLRTLDWVAGVAPQGDALLVDAPAERAAELNMLLAGNGIAVAEIRAQATSLEAFFLEVTQRDA